MLRRWKMILFLLIVVGVVYMGCNTRGMLAAEKYFREENPNMALTPKVCYMLGTAAFRTFRYNLAIQMIDRNVKDFPYEDARVNAEYRRAICYEKLGNYEKAVQLYETFMYDHPKDNRLNSIEAKIAKIRAVHLSE